MAPGFDFVDFTWLKDEQELQAALAPSQAFFNTHAAYRDIDGKHNDGDCDAAATADASAGDGESCDLSASTTGFQYVSRQGDSKDKAFVLTGEQRRKEERRRKQKAMLVGELRHLLKSCKDRNFSVWYK